MESPFKRIGKDSLVYGIGGIASKALAFFLVPVYTRIFSPGDYGTIEMLIVLNGLLGAVLVMGLDSAQSFYFFKKKEAGREAQRELVSAVLQWKLIWGGVLVGMATALSPFLNAWLFDGQLGIEHFAVAFLAALFSQVMSQSSDVFRLLYRPWGYVAILLCQAVASAAIALTLILFLGFGVLGFLLGMLAGAFLASIIGWWSIRSWLDFSHLHTHWWPRLLKFGSPLIPVGMAMYVLNTADRWFIKHHHDERALGLYALASKFAALVAMAITTFRQAWWPIAMDALQSESGPRVYRTIARIYICVGVCCIVLLTASSPYLVRLFATPEYYQSYSVIGILAWSSVFYGFYLIGSGGIWKAEKTIVAPILAGGAALLNIGLNAWFVPEHGYMGAALATTLSFLLWNIFTVIVSEHLWRVNLPYGLFLVQIIVGSGVCYLIHMTYDAGEPFWKVGILSGVCIAVLAALSVNRKEYKIVGKWISERLRRYHWKREKLYK